MIWPHRVVIIVPQAAKQAAESAARAINSTGPEYEGDAFTIALSVAESKTATHFALYTSATAEMVEGMAAALPSIGGVMFWRHGTDGRLQASNVTEPIGQAWGWSESLAAAGLSEVRQPSPYG